MLTPASPGKGLHVDFTSPGYTTEAWTYPPHIRYAMQMAHTPSLTFWVPYDLRGEQAAFQRALPTCQAHLLLAHWQPEVTNYNPQDS